MKIKLISVKKIIRTLIETLISNQKTLALEKIIKILIKKTLILIKILTINQINS